MCQELAIPMTACRKLELQTFAGGHCKYWYVVDSGGVRSYAPLMDDVHVARGASPSWADLRSTCDATIRRLAFGPIVRPLTIGVELFRLCRPSCVVWRARPGRIHSLAPVRRSGALLDLLAAPSGHSVQHWSTRAASPVRPKG